MDYRIVVKDLNGNILEIVDTTYKEVFETWVEKRSSQGCTCELFEKEAGTIEYAAIQQAIRLVIANILKYRKEVRNGSY